MLTATPNLRARRKSLSNDKATSIQSAARRVSIAKRWSVPSPLPPASLPSPGYSAAPEPVQLPVLAQSAHTVDPESKSSEAGDGVGFRSSIVDEGSAGPPALSLPGAVLGKDGPGSPSDNNGLRILIVDDVKDNRRMLSKALKRRLATLGSDGPEVQIDEAEDGHIAVEMVTGQAAPGHQPSGPLPHGGILHEYDAITMDMEMPTMAGFVATRLLREAGFEGLIIGCTGNALEEDQKLFLESGADQVFIKPVDVGMLAKQITMRGLLSPRRVSLGPMT